MRPAETEGKRRRDLAILALLLPAAALFCYLAGRRGLFPFDQSILFDGGYRILLGQVPYRDVFLPFGPVSLGLQGAAFGLLGVTWRSYLLSAALANALATLLAYRLLRRLFPISRAPAVTGAVLTAIWFQPPSGTPFPDQTAFLILLATLAVLVPGLLGPPGPGPGREIAPWRKIVPWREGLAGAGLALIFLTKQNAGLFAAPLVAGLLWTAPWQRARRLAGLLAGATLTFSAFALWLFLVSDPQAFWLQVVVVPGELGWERLLGDARRLLLIPWSGAGPRAPRVAILGLALILVGALASILLRSRRAGGPGLPGGERRRLLAALLALGVVLFQNLHQLSAYNQPQLARPFVGLLAGCALGLTPTLSSGIRGRFRAAQPTLLALAVSASLLLLGVRGVDVSLGRSAHDAFRGSTFGRTLDVEGLRALRWAEPTVIRGQRVEAEDLEGLIEALRELPGIGAAGSGEAADRGSGPGGVWAFPDSTFLHGVVGSPPPQPLLWFHPGLTYPWPERHPAAFRHLEDRILRTLRSADPMAVVVDRPSWLGTDEILDHFPRLHGWLEECFRPHGAFGPWQVRLRRGSARAGSLPVSEGAEAAVGPGPPRQPCLR